MKQRIFSHFQDYLIQYFSHQYQDLLYCNSLLTSTLAVFQLCRSVKIVYINLENYMTLRNKTYL
jgi:hypothetical protein